MKTEECIYIDAVLAQCRKLIYWNGIFSCDNIPDKIRKGEEDFAIIVNLAGHAEPGTHFIVLLQLKGKMFVFDSLALTGSMLPDNLKLWTEEKDAINVLSKPIQDFNSDFCGFYCIYFILWLSLPNAERSKKRFSVLNFDYNLMSNDNKCIKMIVNMLKYQK